MRGLQYCSNCHILFITTQILIIRLKHFIILVFQPNDDNIRYEYDRMQNDWPFLLSTAHLNTGFVQKWLKVSSSADDDIISSEKALILWLFSDSPSQLPSCNLSPPPHKLSAHFPPSASASA